jgi:hypothetical protein
MPPFRCELCGNPAKVLIPTNGRGICPVCYLPHLERQVAECRAMAMCEAHYKPTACDDILACRRQGYCRHVPCPEPLADA